MSYFETIKTAILFFPSIALIITIPFILIQYHKYGSISFLKSLLTYTFVLYFICAYFLVILPLPDISKVALLKTPIMQLIPFNFIIDFIKHISFNNGIVGILKSDYFYMPIFNIFLTMPFGMYLRYFFNYSFRKTVIYGFLLSLFFELTQLSGLYFIYPRSYRLFDVDDLMLNTLGTIIGYLIIGLIVKKLPKMEKINLKAKEKGQKISGLKRTTSFFLDIAIFGLLYSIISVIIKEFNFYVLSISILIYYVLIPYVLRGATLSQKFLNLKIVDNNNKNNFFRLLLRNIFFIAIYIGVPALIIYTIYRIYGTGISGLFQILLIIAGGFYIFIIYFITGIKFLFTNKIMLYEKLSKTVMVSTIKVNDSDIE